MNQKYLLSALLLLLTISCTSRGVTDRYSTEFFPESEMERRLFEIIRYLNGPIRGADYKTMFQTEYDEPYREILAFHELDRLKELPESATSWLLVTRHARSLYERRVAIGIRIDRDNDGELIRYEELFRTWKMAPDELQIKSRLLFDEMVQGADLSRFYTANSGGEEYIEFPTDRVWFDLDGRRWVRDPEDPLSILLQENRDPSRP